MPSSYYTCMTLFLFFSFGSVFPIRGNSESGWVALWGADSVPSSLPVMFWCAIPPPCVGANLGSSHHPFVHFTCSRLGVLNLHRFHQQKSKTVQIGGTPYLTTFGEGFTFLWTPTSAWAPGCRICPLLPLLRGQIPCSEPKFRGGGS